MKMFFCMLAIVAAVTIIGCDTPYVGNTIGIDDLGNVINEGGQNEGGQNEKDDCLVNQTEEGIIINNSIVINIISDSVDNTDNSNDADIYQNSSDINVYQCFLGICS